MNSEVEPPAIMKTIREDKEITVLCLMFIPMVVKAECYDRKPHHRITEYSGEGAVSLAKRTKLS